MSRCNIYLDESGDLGFNFNAPYRAGGSSRHLTLSAVVCIDDCSKHLKRFIADFYRARGIPAGRELKWVDLREEDRLDFAKRAVRLTRTHEGVSFVSITVYKPNVMAHIRADANKLYNYMVGLALLPWMKHFDEVCFVPDARSIKVKSGNSLHDYLQTKLWFDESVTTTLQTNPSDSAKARPLHFTDYLCGAFQSYHEDGLESPRATLAPYTDHHRLFFPSTSN